MSKILCPKCKIPMVLNIETSPTAEGLKVTYFYKCKNCGYKLDDAIMLLKKVEGGYQAKMVEYVS